MLKVVYKLTNQLLNNQNIGYKSASLKKAGDRWRNIKDRVACGSYSDPTRDEWENKKNLQRRCVEL